MSAPPASRSRLRWLQACSGTFTPFAAKWLTSTTGDKASPGYWLMCAAAIGIVGTLTVYRRGGTIQAREAVTA